MNGLTHASFFSGAGGLDLGLERAGWRTVSFSEIDPYASAVLAERWPGIPNLGDIVSLARGDGQPDAANDLPESRRERHDAAGSDDWRTATLWTGGFPCQDLSIAGKRKGLAGSRSGLAYAFLELVGRYRPRIIVLENVPGLLSSNAGRDFYALQRAMAELGYLGAYRVLDARYFGVPQRRRRVFIVGVHVGLDPTGQRAGQILAVGHRCDRHPPPGVKAGPGASPRSVVGVDIAGNLTRRYGKGVNSSVDDGAVVVSGTVRSHVRPGSNDSGGVVVAPTLRVGASGAGSGGSGHAVPIVVSRPADDAGGRGASDRGQASGGEGGQGPAGPSEPLGDPGHREHGDLIRGAGSPEADPGRDGAPDGLARRPHDRPRVAATLNAPGKTGGWRADADQAENLVVYRKATKAHGSGPDDFERWERADVTDTLAAYGHSTASNAVLGSAVAEDPLLPLGLDSHRYRCCGNGVVADVGEFLGLALRGLVE